MRERFPIAETPVFLIDPGNVRPCRDGNRFSPTLVERVDRNLTLRSRLHRGEVQRRKAEEAMEGHSEAEDQVYGMRGAPKWQRKPKRGGGP